jgi:DNA-binding helix-hairpin-helix protein with protein kinase domain
MVACVVAYRHDAAVRRLLPLVRREVHALRGIVEAERATQTIAARVETIRQRSAHDREQAATRKTELRRQEEARLDELRQDLAERLDAVDHRMCDVDRREAEETALVLEELQHRHIRDALRRATLRSASIPGFGPALKMRFWSLGVWAAADVSSDRIGSMQHVKHEHLMEVIAWRVGTETSARRTMPRQLPTQVQQAFHSRYARERDELLAERSHEQVSIQQTMEGVEASFNRRCARVEEQLRKSLEDRAQQCDRLETRLLEIAAQEHVQRADLVAVRQEMEEWGGVSFLLFLQSVYAPWMSRLHGKPRTRRY